MSMTRASLPTLLTLACGLLFACGASSGESVELAKDVPLRINGCTVLMDAAHSDILGMEASCEAPEGALAEERWWGDGERPGAFSMSPGDCLRLGGRYYCVVDMDPPTLKATYESSGGQGISLLRRTKG
jgi:hypothetical protein